MIDRLRPILLNLHIYLGVVTAPYLVLYGVSTVAFNHEWESVNTTEWVRTILPPVSTDGEGTEELIRDRLGLMGNIGLGTVRRLADGSVEFSVHRPGRSYDITTDVATGETTVLEYDRGLLNVLKGMHGAARLSGSWWIVPWAAYTHLSILALGFAALSGPLLWWPRRHRRRLGIVALAIGSGGTIVLAWLV